MKSQLPSHLQENALSFFFLCTNNCLVENFEYSYWPSCSRDSRVNTSWVIAILWWLRRLLPYNTTPMLDHDVKTTVVRKPAVSWGEWSPRRFWWNKCALVDNAPLLWPAEYKANRNIVRHEWGLVWSQSHTLCLVSIHSSNGQHWISAHCIRAQPKRGRYWEIHPRCLRGRRGWISQYLPSFGGVRTFSQHQFFYREWIRKSFPVVREGLTVLKSLLPCWWENAQYSFNVRRSTVNQSVMV